MSVTTHVLFWFQQHYAEVLAVITGLIYIAFTIRENILLWLFGIISSALYVWIFYESGIYAYSLLYIYYVIIGFYGWYHWGKKSEVQKVTSGKLKIRRTPVATLIVCIIVTAILVFPVYFLLHKYTDSDMALIDAILTSGGMVATWMLTQKYVEQWIFWIIIDLLSFAVMIYKGLFPSAFLFAVYGLMAIKGYLEWKKVLKP